MFKLLSKLFRSRLSTISHSSEVQQVGFLMVLMLSVIANRRIRLAESLELNRIIRKIDWKFNAPKQLESIKAEAMAAVSDPLLLEQFVADAAEKIGNEEVVEAVAAICSDVTCAGGHTVVDRHHLNFLAELHQQLRELTRHP